MIRNYLLLSTISSKICIYVYEQYTRITSHDYLFLQYVNDLTYLNFSKIDILFGELKVKLIQKQFQVMFWGKN